MVIVILGLLAAAVVPALFGQREGAEKNLTRSAVDSGLSGALDRYQLDMRRFPTSDEGLRALFDRPSDEEEAKKWNGPYVQDPDKLKDAWGREFKYEAPGQYNTTRYDLSSAGPDGQHGTADDIINWKTN